MSDGRRYGIGQASPDEMQNKRLELPCLARAGLWTFTMVDCLTCDEQRDDLSLRCMQRGLKLGFRGE